MMNVPFSFFLARVAPMRGASDRPGALVFRVAALGDTVLLTAMIRALAEVYGRPTDVVVETRWIDTVLRGVDGLGQAIGITSRGRPYWLSLEQRRLVRWLERRGPSPTFVVDRRSDKVRWLLERGGVGPEYRVEAADHPWRDGEHHVEHLLRLARERPPAAGAWDPAPFPAPPPAPALAVTPDEIRECRAWLAARGLGDRAIVLLQAVSRKANRGRWPDERWVGLVRHVLDALPRAHVLVLGAGHERRHSARLAARCRDERVSSVAGDMPLRRLFALSTICHSLISLDTGPAHVAAVLGCPTLVIAGIVDPRWYRPIGPKVDVVTAIPPERWPEHAADFGKLHRMTDIEVPQVAAAWDRLVRDGRS